MEQPIQRLRSRCVACLANKYTNKIPDDTPEEVCLAYLQGLYRLLAEAHPTLSAPEVVEDITRLRQTLFGGVEDYTEIKPRFNALMLAQEGRLREDIRSAADPLARAVQYAMAGNYIDFGAMEEISHEAVVAQLAQAADMPLLEEEYRRLRQDLTAARRLVYLTDNCGEVVTDKLLLATILEQYPAIQAQFVVRGAPVLNDATMEDARQVGLEQVAPVSHNGTGIAGTALSRISPEARQLLDEADVILAKGQGNFETMRYCGRNVYYLFLCKCRMFAEEFAVPLYSGMLVNDRRLQKMDKQGIPSSHSDKTMVE